MMAPTEEHPASGRKLLQRLPIVEIGIWLSAGLAFILNGILLSHALLHPESGIAGCGGEGGCLEVLDSRWSKVWGVPVTLPGMLVCGWVLVSHGMRWRSGLAFSLALLAGGALWFTGVQVFLLGSFCPLCCAAHVAAVITLVSGMIFLRRSGISRQSLRAALLAGGLATIALASAQWWGPVPVSHRIEGAPKQVAGERIHAQGSGRMIAFAGGNKRFNVTALPRIGRPDASRVMVEYFDYSCDSCRVMHGFLQALSERHPGQIAILCLPVPFEAACNARMTPADPVHPGACHLARIALAVWRAAPGKFQALHDSFFATIPVNESEAMVRASQFISREQLTEALADPWIDELLRANAEDWAALSGTSRKMPKLWVKDSRILHGLPSGKEDFIQVLKDELGL
jgi:uncharacterized membrane protein